MMTPVALITRRSDGAELGEPACRRLPARSRSPHRPVARPPPCDGSPSASDAQRVDDGGAAVPAPRAPAWRGAAGAVRWMGLSASPLQQIILRVSV